MKEFRNKFMTKIRRQAVKKKINETRKKHFEDNLFDEGPSDGENDIEEDLREYLLETKPILKSQIESKSPDLIQTVHKMKTTLIDSAWLIKDEFKMTNIDKMLLNLLKEDLKSQPQFLSDIFSILGTILINQKNAEDLVHNLGVLVLVHPYGLSEGRMGFLKDYLFMCANLLAHDKIRDFCVEEGFADHLMEMDEDVAKEEEIVVEFARALCNLSAVESGGKSVDYELSTLYCDKALKIALNYKENFEILKECIWVLNYFVSRGPKRDEKCKLVSKSKDANDFIISCLEHHNKTFKLPALKILGNITTGKNETINRMFKQAMINVTKILILEIGGVPQ